jgi:hypothetical protein
LAERWSWTCLDLLDLEMTGRKSPGNLENFCQERFAMLMRYDIFFGGTLRDSYGMWEIMG